MLVYVVAFIMTYEMTAERKWFIYYRGTKKVTGITQLSQLKARSILIIFSLAIPGSIPPQAHIFSLK